MTLIVIIIVILSLPTNSTGLAAIYTHNNQVPQTLHTPIRGCFQFKTRIQVVLGRETPAIIVIPIIIIIIVATSVKPDKQNSHEENHYMQ